MANPVNERRVGDGELSKSSVYPNAANTTYTNSIDLRQVVPFPTTGDMWLKVTGTVATGANNKNINIRIQHSHEAAANFINIPTLANPIVQTLSANDVHPVINSLFPMPNYGLRRYIRGAALGETNGADSVDGSFTLSVLF
jgi:hypothetical protein